jgi:hypothetical protein
MLRRRRHRHFYWFDDFAARKWRVSNMCRMAERKGEPLFALNRADPSSRGDSAAGSAVGL